MDAEAHNGCLSSCSWFKFPAKMAFEAVWPTNGLDWELVEVVRPVDNTGCVLRQPKMLQIVCPIFVENKQ